MQLTQPVSIILSLSLPQIEIIQFMDTVPDLPG